MIFAPHLSTLACFVLSSSHHGSRGPVVKNLATETTTSRSLSKLAAGGLEDIADVSREISLDSYDRLLKWLKSKGAIVNDNLCFKPSTRGGGLGVFCNGNIAKDEMLVRIPRSACVTLDDVRSDPESGESFEKLMAQAGPGGNTVAIAGILAKERLIAQAKGSEASKFGPYLDTLPWERGINNQEHILFWSDDDVDTLLKGTMCYGEARTLREEVDLAINVLNKIIGTSIRVARGELSDTKSGFSLPWEPKPEPEKGLVDGLSDAVRGAFVCLLTRSFQNGDEDKDEEQLVPWLDMLQHNEEPNIRHKPQADGAVEVRAGRDLQAGEELFNRYRSEEEEAMPYHRFFTRYGFVPGISENIPNLLKDKSSFFFTKKAEV